MPDEERGGVSGEVSREKLEKELQGIEDAVERLEQRVQDIEDTDMMAQLESMTLEEELREVENLLDHMDREELEKRLNMIEQIKEEYQEGKVHEKLEYLYRQIKDIREQLGKEQASARESSEETSTKLEQRIDQLEDRIQNLGDTSGEKTGLGDKYKKAVRSNYSQLKQLKNEIKKIENYLEQHESGQGGADQEELERLRSKIDRFEDDIQDRVEELEESVEESHVERRRIPEESGEHDVDGSSLSSIRFDLDAIKSRISELEERDGVSGKLDLTEVRSLKRRVKKLEEKADENQLEELEAFKQDLENQLRQLDEEKISEEELGQEVQEEIEKVEEEIDDKIRQLGSEIDRAVKKGEDRLSTLEETVNQQVLKRLDSEKQEFSSKIERSLELIQDNQKFIERLENELEQLDIRVARNNQKIEEQVEKMEQEVEKGQGQVQETMEEIASTVRENESILNDEMRNLREQLDRFENFDYRLETVEEKIEEQENARRQVQLPSRVENVRFGQFEEEPVRPQTESVEAEADIERKLDNLLEHVMDNQERIHEIENFIRSKPSRSSEQSAEDITIIS